MKKYNIYGLIIIIAILSVIFCIHIADYIFIRPISMMNRNAYCQSRIDMISNALSLRMSNYFDSAFNSILQFRGDVSKNEDVYQLCENIIKTDDNFVGACMYFFPETQPGNKEKYPTVNTLAKKRHQDIKGHEAEYEIDPLTIKDPEAFKDINIISEPFISGACKNSKIFTMTLPDLGMDGTPVSIVQIAISIDSLIKTIESENPYKRGKIYLVSKGGRFVYHPDHDMITKPSKEWYKNNFSPEINDLIDIESNNIFDSHLALTSQNDTLVYTSSDYQSDWKIIYIAPYKDIIEDLEYILWIVIFISFLGAIIIVTICSIVIRRLSKNFADMIITKNELLTASKIQTSMLENPEIKDHRIKVDANLIPARMVGGDLYYYFHVDAKNKLHFCIGDVSGKGVPAALYMGRAITLIRVMSYAHTPAALANMLNKELCFNNSQYLFITMFIGNLDLNTGKLTYCNAGHELPIIGSNNGIDYLTTKTHIPLGIDASISYSDEEILLQDESIIMLYTDGVSEATNSENQLYGNVRILDTVKEHYSKEPLEINKAIIESIKKFVGNNEQNDDITIMTISYNRLNDNSNPAAVRHAR